MVDFYISDYQSGLRALVKVGYGATVSPYVEESTLLDITEKNRELPTAFMRWLAERNLSSDDRVMRLKEGYVTCFSGANSLGGKNPFQEKKAFKHFERGCRKA